MDKIEHAQLLKHDASIVRLEKVVTVLSRRLVVLEKENAKLKHAMARTNNDVSSMGHKITKG
jgi:hypothetical protein